jgi:hypothetical protein
MMRRVAVGCIFVVLVAVLASSAEAAEFDKFAVEAVEASLSTNQAGAHPDFTTTFRLTAKENQPYANARNIDVELPPGIFGNPKALPTCSSVQFGTDPTTSHCPQDAQVGVTEITLGGVNAGTFPGEPIYNMETPKGQVARLGFYSVEYPTFINIRLRPDDQGLTASLEGLFGAAPFVAATTTLWGVPPAPVHDFERVTPLEVAEGVPPPPGGRQSTLPEVPFMTNPTSCDAERQVSVTAVSYQLPEAPSSLSELFPAIASCELLKFRPETEASTTTEQATTGSGLNYRLTLPTDGLEHPNLLYDSELKRAEVILPEGMTVNPSEAEGLGVCSEADLARETYGSGPNEGCPETSKIGSLSSTTPVLSDVATGSIYLAKPYENPFGSLLALYMVLKIPDRGVVVKLAGKVTPDPVTGQLRTVFDDVPQLPVSSFDLHFREGARAPLVTPSTCGTYAIVSKMNPWSNPAKTVTTSNPFAIGSGVDHGPCPAGGAAPFHPTLVAGTTNNSAGRYSPFYIRLARTDSEQEITHFSIKLPPGIVGKLAGVPFCSDAAIAAAAARKGPHGGAEELSSPSCPQASQIGTTLVGAGVGQVLAWAPGKVYLAGPYHGSSLSIAAITAAKVGPFDLGTVVVREALKVNPETAEVFVDATGSDPIPHIIQGIPVHLRDIRVSIDKPEFVLNPTSCERTSTASTVLGSGVDFGSESDDQPVTVTSPFQAADCASLDFAPKLKLTLKGGTKRGATPKFRAVLAARKGDANIGAAQVTLPHSEFLEQGHIRTICTRVQYAAEAVPGAGCPAASVYGFARAITPILDEPLEGPVYLRSSSHNLPDLVAALHSGKIDINLVGRIDSVKGRIRNTFETVPDAPVTRFTLEMQGGKKGLLVNSTDLCRTKHRAIAAFTGQNGKEHDFQPVLEASCGKKGSHNRR